MLAEVRVGSEADLTPWNGDVRCTREDLEATYAERVCGLEIDDETACTAAQSWRYLSPRGAEIASRPLQSIRELRQRVAVQTRE